MTAARAIAITCAAVTAITCYGLGARPAQAATVARRSVAPATVSAADLAGLPGATTFARLVGAPADPAPDEKTDGLVVHPRHPVVVFASPGGRAVAVLPETELGAPTWVPVIQERPGWKRVLLPSRPNGATGWLSSRARLDTWRTPYLIRISLHARKLRLYYRRRLLRTWPVAIGAVGTPTPVGRTFVLALIEPTSPTYSRYIMPLGFHSETLDSFGGGPGTVALHGWPDSSVFGHAVSHGCVRVPGTALNALIKVPLGSLVLISRR